MEKEKTIRCINCNEILNPNNIVWLELSMTDGNFYLPEEFPENHESQGCFEFGSSCWKKVVKRNGEG